MASSVPFPQDVRNAHFFIRDAAHDRIVGALIGSALGDAIGLYTEFLSGPISAQTYPSGTFTLWPKATSFYGDMHRLKHQAGDWTDDTDHALLILLSFLHNGELLPKDFAQRLKTWVDMGLRALDTPPLGLGNLVGSIVRKPEYVEDPEGSARAKWEATRRMAAPNGSLMRTHPIGLICLTKGDTETFEIASHFSRMTHVDPRCVISCVIGTALMRSVVRGETQSEDDIDATVQRVLEWFLEQPQEEKFDIDELHRHTKAKTLAELKLDEPQKIGYVYKTLGSGILLLRLALQKTNECQGDLLPQQSIFEDLITNLIMRGGDADTNACFAGALVGGHLGYRTLPGHWKHGLRHEKWLMSKSEALCRVLGVTEGSYDGKADKDTHLDGGKGFLTIEDMQQRWGELEKGIYLRLEAEAKARSTPVGGKKSGWGLWKS